MLGDYQGLFEAQSTRKELTRRGGGGVVSTLLITALREGILRDALVVGSSDQAPWAAPMLARTEDQVLSASGSKYTFVHYPHFLRKQLDSQSAMVGLPCQIHRCQEPYLRLGLFCGLNLAPGGLYYLIDKLQVDLDRITSLDYRKPGGGLRITCNDGDIVEYGGYSWLAYFFPLRKCLHCTNYSNVWADISIGDRRPGWSSVIVRTERGAHLFRRAVAIGVLKANTLSRADLIRGSMSPLIQKEHRGGFVNTMFVREYEAWIEKVPLSILRIAGKGFTFGQLISQKIWLRFHTI
jgi:coenzyme F420 hydrogenase subunit beta